MSESLSAVVQIATIIVMLAGGVKSVPLLQWIKVRLNLTKGWSRVATVTLGVILAIAGLLVNGAITAASFAPELAVELFLAVLIASQSEYNRLKRQHPSMA